MVVKPASAIGADICRSDIDHLEAIGALAGLDDTALRRRWRRVIHRPLPEGLGRALALRILAYHQQAQRYGDLDRASAQALAAFVRSRDALPGGGGDGPVSVVGSAKKAAPRRSLRPGSILAREHDGKIHRVMVLDAGFAWAGKTYASLSQVAFAITGTRWNGPRFFGLQDKQRMKRHGRAAMADAASGARMPAPDPSPDPIRSGNGARAP
jgi:hypothetical protein